MLELVTEIAQVEVPTQDLGDLAALQLALVGGGCGTAALE